MALATLSAHPGLADPGAPAQTLADPLACPNRTAPDDGIAAVCVVSSARQDDPAAAEPIHLLQRAQEALLGQGASPAGGVIDLYRASSEQANPLAEYDLGYFYEHGIGVSRDPSQALALYRRAFAHAEDGQLRLLAQAAIDGLEDQPAPAAGPSASGSPPAAIETLMPVLVDEPSEGGGVAPPAEMAKAAGADPSTASPPPDIRSAEPAPAAMPPQPNPPATVGESLPVSPGATAAGPIVVTTPAMRPPAPPSPAPPQPAASQQPDTLPTALVAALLSRGDEMLRLGDIVAARLLFEYAANAGSGEAAIGAGKTHDARYLAQVHAIGVVPDEAAAARWYRRAAALGDRNADRLLSGLEAVGAKSSEK